MQRAELPAGAEVGGARIVLAPSGAGVVDWVVADPPPAAAARSGLLSRQPGGVLGAPVLLERALATAPVMLRDGRALLLGGRADGWRYRGLAWASYADGGSPRWHRLTDATLPLAPSLAANARGDAIAAWVERRGQGVRLRASLRRAGGHFRRPFTVLDDPRTSWDLDGLKIALSTAVGGDGRIMLAYAGRPSNVERSALRVYAWLGAAAGRDLGRRTVVGPHEGYVKLTTALTTRHRAFVIWGSQSGGIEAGSPWRVRAASRAPRATRFGRAQLVDPGGRSEFSPAPVLSATGPRGSVIAAWGTGSYDRSVVRVAESADRAALGAPERLPSSTTLTGLAERRDGAVLITWSAVSRGAAAVPPAQAGASAHDVGAAYRGAGVGSFSAAEGLGIRLAQQAVTHRQPPLGAAVFDPRTGDAITAFVTPAASGGRPVLELVTRRQ